MKTPVFGIRDWEYGNEEADLGYIIKRLRGWVGALNDARETTDKEGRIALNIGRCSEGGAAEQGDGDTTMWTLYVAILVLAFAKRAKGDLEDDGEIGHGLGPSVQGKSSPYG